LKLNKLDNYDMKILGILTIDCRTPDRQIGKKVGLSGVSVKSRISKMERAGVIQNSTMFKISKLVNSSSTLSQL